MKTLRGRLPELLLAALVPVAFVACGDDSNGGTTPEPQTEFATLADAGVCDQTRFGEMVFVIDENSRYICDGRNWTSESGGESSEGGSSVEGSSDGGFSVDGSSSSSSSSSRDATAPRIVWWSVKPLVSTNADGVTPCAAIATYSS